MENIKPATPAQAATPGSNEPNVNSKPSVVAPAPATPVGNQGNNQGAGPQGQSPEGQNTQEGTVTIPLKEYRGLQRDGARYKSFQKRAEFKKNTPGESTDFSNEDPELVDLYRKEQDGHTETKRALHKEQVTNKVRDILSKEEYKNLPKSTRDLILKNPAALSEAETIEEALLDIEDFVRDQVADLGNVNQDPNLTAQTQKDGQSQPNEPSGHETPPVVNTGTPAPANADGLEDVENLSGMNRSRAVLRNIIKKKAGVK